MKFNDAKELANHKSRVCYLFIVVHQYLQFCVGTLYHDPAKLEDHIARLRDKKTQQRSNETIGDILRNLQQDEDARESMRMELLAQLGREVLSYQSFNMFTFCIEN